MKRSGNEEGKERGQKRGEEREEERYIYKGIKGNNLIVVNCI